MAPGQNEESEDFAWIKKKMHSHFWLVMVNEVNGGHYLSLRSAQKEIESIKTNSRWKKKTYILKQDLFIYLLLDLLSCYVNYKSVRKKHAQNVFFKKLN